MRTLFLIPARAGSKGLPGKNVKELAGIPLIGHTILFAKEVAEPNDIICVSTDDEKVLELLPKYGLDAPFVRPAHLSNDDSGTYPVIKHAQDYYSEKGIEFERVLLLQPTSPFRNSEDYQCINHLYAKGCDMVVSVTKSKANPYFNLFEEDSRSGFLYKSKPSRIVRRQDCPEVYTFNGAFYLMKASSIRTSDLSELKSIRKYEMSEERSIDIDNMTDWIVAEYYLTKQLNEND